MIRYGVPGSRGRYRVVHPEREFSDDPSPLDVKGVWVGDLRYIVCRNEDEACKNAADREAIVASSREQLRSGAKLLVGNRGYGRYLSRPVPDSFQIDEAKIAEDARHDGKWVLRTNTVMDAADVALQYKRLWMVEQWFRSCKSLIRTRPIYHHLDATIRGHVFCSFLALVLRQELQARLEKRGHDHEWADVIQDLGQLHTTEVQQDVQNQLDVHESLYRRVAMRSAPTQVHRPGLPTPSRMSARLGRGRATGRRRGTGRAGRKLHEAPSGGEAASDSTKPRASAWSATL